MLPTQERLTRSSLFQRAYTARKSINSPLVSLYVLPKLKQQGGKSAAAGAKHSENDALLPTKSRSTAKMPLVGFVVAKKVCKSACVRNRAKRQLREAYRLLRRNEQGAALELSQWYALVWVIHDAALAATWKDVQNTVFECLTRAKAKYGNGPRPQRPEEAGRHEPPQPRPPASGSAEKDRNKP